MPNHYTVSEAVTVSSVFIPDGKSLLKNLLLITVVLIGQSLWKKQLHILMWMLFVFPCRTISMKRPSCYAANIRNQLLQQNHWEEMRQRQNECWKRWKKPAFSTGIWKIWFILRNF